MASSQNKIFPFLKLAPELRNHIYELAAISQKRIELTHSSHTTSCERNPDSVFSLTRVCRQIRSGFRPMCLAESMLTIDLRDLNLFLTEFFPASGEVEQTPVPLHIVVWIRPHDIAKAQKFDLRPIFLSRAKNKRQQWFFISLGSLLLSCEDMVNEWNISRLHETFCSSCHMSDTFLQRIETGFISDFILRDKKDGFSHPLITVTKNGASKKNGGLSKEEVDEMESYCEDFRFFGGLVAQVATVRVRDERGKHVEEFHWQGKKLARKCGKDWKYAILLSQHMGLV